MQAALSRRALFSRFRGGPEQLRPPWAKREDAFTESCTCCDACIAACPTKVLTKGHAGYPIVDFARAACTFCRACAEACGEGCFQPSRAENRPWQLEASISTACVELKGVVCRMCEEACEASAIRFRPRLGGGSNPSVDPDHCSGCGACVAPCPVKAVSVAMPRPVEASS